MEKLRFLTAGESHGRGLVGILEGLPAGLGLDISEVDRELARRQGGYGRGGRMKIERDRAEVLSGVRWGETLGSPLALVIWNRDWENWTEGMSIEAKDRGSIPAVTRPRPGHADLVGSLKYQRRDARDILERSSARETAMRVALGALAKIFLNDLGINIGSYVTTIGPASMEGAYEDLGAEALLGLFERAEASEVRCPDPEAGERMKAEIDRAGAEGYSLGGIFEVFITGLPVGLGSHIQWDRRLEAELSRAIMSIQAIKGVEVGLGFEAGRLKGPECMDEIILEEGDFGRSTNRAGGIEGGMSTGLPVILRAAMKPIPTQMKPLRSADMITKEPFEAVKERSDTCAVPAAAVVAEAMAALAAADAVLEKFGGDSMAETRRNLKSYGKSLEEF